MKAGVVGTGMYVPPKVLTNDDLVAMGLMIVLATSSPDVILSSTAAIVQHKLGCTNAGAFDINSVCSGFVYAFDVGARMALDPHIDYVLVIGAEVYSKILNWEDRTTCVYFGDGAGAAVVAPVEEGGYIGSYLRVDGSGAEVIQIPAGGTKLPLRGESYLRVDGSGAEVIQIPAGGTKLPLRGDVVGSGLEYFHMDGRAVWDFATVKFPEAVERVVERHGYSLEDVDLVVPHQSNVNMIRVGMERLGLPMERAYVNLEKYANCAGASIPMALHEASKDGSLKRGDLLVTVGYGGGLSWGANLVRW